MLMLRRRALSWSNSQNFGSSETLVRWPARLTEYLTICAGGDGSGAASSPVTLRPGEKVIPLVVRDDKGGEILDVDPPDGLHAELLECLNFHLLDVVLGENGGGTADRAEIEAAMLFTGIDNDPGAIALGEHDHAAAGGHELIDIGIHAPGRRRSERAGSVAVRCLGGARIINDVILEILRQVFARFQHFAQLLVGEVAGHDDRAGQAEAGADRILAERCKNLFHGPVEVDLDDLAAEILVGNFRQIFRGVRLKLLKEDAFGRDLALDLAVRRAGDADSDGDARAVAGQADD